ncbi:MAG: hypothetical protein NWF06_03895 [Candidatus Bathyarchaeota archaeon]|nr:hypothetical protein [Candidatus Bathyarchaeum sp.]
MAYDAIKKAKALLVQKENLEKVKSLILRKELFESTKPVSFQTEHVDKPKPASIRNEHVENSEKSKLMICIEVLCTLVSSGPMTMTQLLNRFEMDECRLEPHVRLLWNRGLIEEETFDNDTAYYVVTERGLTVLKVVSPLIREAHKIQIRDLELISSTLSGAGYS